MAGLFGSPKAPPPPPPAPRMPDQQDPAVLEAQRQRIQVEMGRNGRQSTILSAGGQGMGAGVGGKTTLG